jgi:Tol biopolymer transport system component
VGSVAWSPDGKQVALIQYTPGNLTNSTSLELTEWKSARRQIILSDARLGSALYWLPDGRLLYVLGQDAWAITLRSAKINGTPTHITRGLGQISTITASADGKLLAFVRESWQPHIYIATLSRDGRQLLTSRRLTLEESLDFPDTWTPDSKSVLFVSDRNGTTEIFKQAVDEALAESVVAGPDQKMDLPRLSPDGLEILYISTPRLAGPDAPSAIFAIPIRGGAPRLVLKDIGINNLGCARLPSTTCLYSIQKGNTQETFRFDVRSGKSTAPPQIDTSCQWSLSPQWLRTSDYHFQR